MTTAQTSTRTATYRDRVMACWLGKAVGGTLGMSREGEDGPFDLTYYDPQPTRMEPNDDLDLQVVWAVILDQLKEVRVDRGDLAAAWLKHVGFCFDEYGAAIRNMKHGIAPPLSGAHDNWFTDGMGAAIRSELWACLAPGNPKLAAAYAYEDACVDHVGDGLNAAVFLAAMESQAFDDPDINLMIEAGLRQIPNPTTLYCAIQQTRMWHEKLKDWREVRALILENYGHENFTDVTMNLCFIVLGLLEGAGDFDRTICTAVNCGKDTDCTGATAAAIMGIADPHCITPKWLKPIGRSLQLSPQIQNLKAPTTLDAFTDLVIDLRKRLGGRKPEPRTNETVQSPPARIRMAYAGAAAPWFGAGWPTSVEPQLPCDLNFIETAVKGTVHRMASELVPGPALVVRYPINITKTQRVCLMFNTPQPCRVWLDEEYLFGRDGGRMAPSFHRVPINQFARLTLSAGEHTITAAMVCPTSDDLHWVVGIGDDTTSQWLTDAFIIAED